MRVANAAVRALTRVYGTSYKAGTSSNIICKCLPSADTRSHLYISIKCDDYATNANAYANAKIIGRLTCVTSMRCRPCVNYPSRLRCPRLCS